MELWIRSQDKSRLLKVNNVQITEYNGYSYITTDIDDDEIELGEYGFHNSQRALEVLDEIQRYILLPNTDNSAYVFEMPEE